LPRLKQKPDFSQFPAYLPLLSGICNAAWNISEFAILSLFLRSGGAGLVTASRLRPALFHLTVSKLSTFGPALVKATMAVNLFI
jgi:hypothetical protein